MLVSIVAFSVPQIVAQEDQVENVEQVDESQQGELNSPEETIESQVVKKNEEEPAIRIVNSYLFSVLFFDVSFGYFSVPEVDRNGQPVVDGSGMQKIKDVKVPLVVAVLGLGAIFFTLFYGFINFRGFKHAIDIVKGQYDDPNDHGEISHFRALTSALSATIGLGNIAGVAVAIQIGGPGAVCWMILMAVFGMCSKFSSCTLAQLYRQENSDGSISGGPMYYLDLGLANKTPLIATLGKFLAIMYALMVMGGAIGGGNMFQANQTVEAFQGTFNLVSSSDWIIGFVMAVLVGAVILGGIKRIGAATSKIVPIMCGIYVLASLAVILTNYENIPAALGTIFREGFSGNAFLGGIVGVMVTGIQRAAFSNEAGLGSAAIAHASAKTDEPVREGLVAMLGPFIDTIIVCFMTAMVVVVTGTYQNPELAAQGKNLGVTLTSTAFATVLPWFPYVLTICIALFAYSTMISWCYYGERGCIYLAEQVGLGTHKVLFVYRMLFVGAIFIGATHPLKDVIDFTDAMILSMALPNILGSIFLAPEVRRVTRDYMRRLKNGQIEKNNH